MSDVAIKKFSSGRDQGEMDELKKLILSEKARTKHLSDGPRGGGGGGGGIGGRRVDGGDVSDDDEGEGDARERDGGRGRVGGAKEKKPKGTWRRGKLIITNDASDPNKYRDRAEERRKGHNPDYADKLNQMASMDAETTKYLGGDIEHTHLVKGLDYALLVKIRDEERHRQTESSQGGVGDELDGERGDGRREVRARTLTGKTVLAVLRRLSHGQGPGGHDFKRINYEFDLDADSLQEIPTAVAQSVGEDGDDAEDGDDGERQTNYLMEEGLLERVQSAFTMFRQHGGRARRHRKRARDKAGGGGKEEEDAIVAALAKSAGASNDGAVDMEEEGGSVNIPPHGRRAKFSINIFEDVDDRYVPPGSVASATTATTPKGATGYFSGLRAQKDGEAGKSAGAEMLPSRTEMSATVKAAARAAAARLAADKKPTSAASATSSASTGGTSARGRGVEGGVKIERDIFAKRPSRGQALGVASGGYDVYPETGDFETYDSDEDTTNKKDAKPGPEGGLSGGGVDNPDNHPAFDKPKASFPFGIKKAEMSSRKPSGGKGRRVDNELNMIKKYMHGEK